MLLLLLLLSIAQVYAVLDAEVEAHFGEATGAVLALTTSAVLKVATATPLAQVEPFLLLLLLLRLLLLLLLLLLRLLPSVPRPVVVVAVFLLLRDVAADAEVKPLVVGAGEVEPVVEREVEPASVQEGHPGMLHRSPAADDRASPCAAGAPTTHEAGGEAEGGTGHGRLFHHVVGAARAHGGG